MERARLPAVIELARGDDPPTEVYVRGHFEVDHRRALEAARLYLDELAEYDHWDGWTPGKLGIACQAWGRWGFPPADVEDRDAIVRWFYLVDRPQRGAFPVTVIVDLDDREARRLDRQAQADHAAELERLVAAWHPEAFAVTGHGYPIGRGQVRFRLPGLLGDVAWSPDKPGTVWVQRRDLETWQARYAGRSVPLKMIGAVARLNAARDAGGAMDGHTIDPAAAKS